MSISFDRFSQEVVRITPIVDGWGKVGGRKFNSSVKDGWYQVTMGNKVVTNRLATQLEIFKTLKEKKSFLVYSVGTEGVPVNFDNFLRRGMNESVSVNFLKLGFLDVAKIVEWEDKRLYFYEQEISYQKEIIQKVKEIFNKKEILGKVHKITPEIRFSFLLGELARGSYEEAIEGGTLSSWVISSSVKSSLGEKIHSSFPTRLKSAVERAGAEYISHSKKGAGYVVEWRIHNQIVKSVIQSDLRIVSAGYCLSGDDKKHSVHSIINLAKEFQKEEGSLYITRE